ncbi:MAG: type II secretion system protein M [Acetobacteraceae bacterium]|nr:type II secretion system protein M [Acetobacteraceae bacterium]
MHGVLPGGVPGRMLALGLTLLALVLIWFAVIGPLLRLYDEGAATLEQQRILAHRMAQLAGMLPELQHQAEAQAGTGPAPNALLEGATDAIAGATLQERVQDMATTAGARVSSAEMLQPAQTGAYRRIGLRIACNAPWAVLVRLLQSIEQATPRMLIDDMRIHGPRVALQTPEPVLNAEFTVLAFRAGVSGAGG